MPVRSLRSAVLRWPDREAVDRAVRAWAGQIARVDERVLRVGYFGSYAEGRWGVGSDVDLVVVVSDSDAPFERRPLGFDTLHLPVPADLFVYTEAEWQRMSEQGGLPRTASATAVWVLER